jgi:hypothetical protein
MASPNGGIIGVLNPTSFGKCTVTSQTSSGTLTTQPGTRLVTTAVVAGGGGGGTFRGGGGGAGGLRTAFCISLWSNSISNYSRSRRSSRSALYIS